MGRTLILKPESCPLLWLSWVHSTAYHPALELLVGDLAPDLPWGFC